MKLLKDIPIEKYNDINFVLEYLRNNPEAGDEKVTPIEYFHCFWSGSPLSDLHLMSLQSLIETHPNANIILWTTNIFEICGSNSAIRIQKLLKNNLQIIEITKKIFEEARSEILYSKYLVLLNNYQHNPRLILSFASDIVRFSVLQIYGGLWFDLDILFLRNFNSIKIKQYMPQWQSRFSGNGCILRLEKNHNVLKQLKNFPDNIFQLETFNLDSEFDIILLPSIFFDIVWHADIKLHNMPDRDEFLTLSELNLPKEIYAYHWHNNWNKKPPPFFKFIV